MIKKIQSIVLESNFFVALGVWSLVKLTGLLHGVAVDEFAIFSFFSTQLVYSFSILFTFGRTNGFDTLFCNSKLLVQKVIFVTSMLALPYFVFQLNMDVLLMLIPVGLVSFLYPVEIISENEKGIALREFPYLKIFLIGISWGVVTVILPLMQADENVSNSVFIETFVRAMFVVAITIPFDVRDVYSDSPEMRTLPQRLGVTKAKLLAYLLLAVNFLYYFLLGSLTVETLVFILIALFVTSVLIRYSSNERPKYYYVVFIELTSVLLFLSTNLLCC
jgi:4-hydroxybenzoate polyprenyltransferase